MSLALPCTFGRYTLLRELGRGGMAEIFLARAVGAHGFERRLVIKRMHAHLSQDPAFTRMFIWEARLSARLVHANVVPVFDFGESEGHLYLAMECVDGVDLRPILRGLRARNDPMPVEVAAFISIEILRGLDYAHRLADPDGRMIGLVHRDVSPSNILVSREGEVKVCDFGIALVGNDHMTATGTLKGKFAYMAPEQSRGQVVDRRSDIFGVGLVLWEMIAGRRCYVASDDVQTLLLAQKCQVAPLPVQRAPNGDRLAGIVHRALSADPNKRPNSAAALADELQDYLTETGLVGSSGRLATFLRERCSVEMEKLDQRANAEEGTSTARTPSIHSTFTSLPNLPADWMLDGPRAPPAGQENQTRALRSPPSRSGTPTPTTQPGDDGRALKVPLLRHLAAAALITPEQAYVSLRHAERWACRLTAALLAHRFVSESDLCHALSRLHSLPVVDLARTDVSPRVFRKVPQALAERLDVVPFALETSGGRTALCVAFADPESLAFQRDLAFAAGASLKPHLARFSAVTGMLRRLYRREEAPVPPLFAPGTAEPPSGDGEMVIERFDGESIVNTAVDELELDDQMTRRFRP